MKSRGSQSLRLYSGSHTLAAQEFHHTSQGDNVKFADFIRWLGSTFSVAYGRWYVSFNPLLHGQLQGANTS